MSPSLPGDSARPPTSVVLQCRDPLLRGLLADWLDRRAGLVAVAVVRDGRELLCTCGIHHPDLAILEADPVGWNALRLLERLRECSPVRSIGLHHSLSRAEVRRLHGAGFDRLVNYAGGLPSLALAIRRLTSPTADAEVGEAGDSPNGVRLTPRELDVLRLLGLGLRSAQIGTALGVRPATVENHKRRVFAKLDVHGETQAVAVALRRGLLATGGPTADPVGLTPREREIISLAAAGYSVKQTAHTLRVSVKTVESIQRHLFSKLGVHGRSGALAAVYGYGYKNAQMAAATAAPAAAPTQAPAPASPASPASVRKGVGP
jgi:DNA-binding NarL/FixJ family response regulator